MSSNLVLTEAIIDDSDLCLNKLRDVNSFEWISEELVSDQSQTDGNSSTDEFVLAFDETIADDLELMESMGLPTGFTSRSENKRPDNRKKKRKNRNGKKNKRCQPLSYDIEELNLLFEKYWSESGDKLFEDSWIKFCKNDGLNQTKQKTLNDNDFGSDSAEYWTQVYEKHWFEVYNSVYHKFVEDFNKRSEEILNSVEESFEVLPQMLTKIKINDGLTQTMDTNDSNSSNDKKSGDRDNKSDDKPNASSSTLPITGSTKNDGNGNDGDEPPEERPSRVKREHESDSIDLSEELIETEDKPEVKQKQISRKKRKSKYWHQRYRLFSLFDGGIKLDNESWYSVTPERIAEHIAKRFSINNNLLIIDAFCGAGGNTIQFASISPQIRVIAIDIDERKISLAKHNSKIYGVDHRIEFIVADYLLLAKTGALKADAVFLSPPWGGPTYLKQQKYSLDMMKPNGTDIFEITDTFISRNIGFLLPRNIDTKQLEELAANKNSCVEVEQNLLNNKVKTVTAYFGNLIKTNTE